MKDHAIIISPVWPGYDSGYSLAVLSSLRVYAKVFKTIEFVSLSKDTQPELPDLKNVSWESIPVLLAPKHIRFIRSLFSKYPASIQAFNNNQLQYMVLNVISKHRKDLGIEENLVIVFEDLPVTALMNSISKEYPGIQFFLRSHNVLGEAFEGLQNDNRLQDLLWKLEISRIKKYEKHVLEKVHRCWAITARDAQVIKQYYHLDVNGVLGINFLEQEFPEPGKYEGSISVLLHLGTADLRKGHGLQLFIKNSWAAVRSDFPEAKFIIGGRNTSRLTNVKSGIFGLGYVEDQTAFFNKGKIFVNTQLLGTGIKVKSLIAMLHGKVLVSTVKGVEGIGGEDGVHYLVANDSSQMNQAIKRLFRNPGLANMISTNARKYILDNYVFSEKLVKDFIGT